MHTVPDVQRKVKNLRSQYTRERRMSRSKTGQGTADDVYVSKWQYLDAMSFIEEFVTARQTTPEVSDS